MHNLVKKKKLQFRLRYYLSLFQGIMSVSFSIVWSGAHLIQCQVSLASNPYNCAHFNTFPNLTQCSHTDIISLNTKGLVFILYSLILSPELHTICFKLKYSSEMHGLIFTADWLERDITKHNVFFLCCYVSLSSSVSFSFHFINTKVSCTLKISHMWEMSMATHKWYWSSLYDNK